MIKHHDIYIQYLGPVILMSKKAKIVIGKNKWLKVKINGRNIDANGDNTGGTFTITSNLHSTIITKCVRNLDNK
jgi:hypothetical protein